MHGHVCENEGTREVLAPRPLDRCMFKNLLESLDRLRKSGQNSMVNELMTSHKIKGARRNKIEDSDAAQDCAEDWCYYTWSSGNIYLCFK